jgi:predicted DNA-binding antitoxin AbrB/MazE fold protein
MQTIHAIFENGVFRPIQPVELPAGAEVRIAIEPCGTVSDPLASVIGIGEGPEQGDVAKHHDDYLYGHRQP